MHNEETYVMFGIQNGATEVSVIDGHGLPLHKYFEEQLDNMQGKLWLERQSWSKKMPREGQESHGFYDLVAEYV